VNAAAPSAKIPPSFQERGRRAGGTSPEWGESARRGGWAGPGLLPFPRGEIPERSHLFVIQSGCPAMNDRRWNMTQDSTKVAIVTIGAFQPSACSFTQPWNCSAAPRSTSRLTG
jgi:hypothetical protein